jgi:DNA-binding LacI/PurR family transcriptional regulator
MSQNATIDSAGKGPKYKRVYLELRGALTDGTHREGDKLPSENELVERFGVSRPTVRRALSQLVSEGFIARRMGAGTVVSNRSENQVLVFGLLIPELGTTEIFEPICQGISQAQNGGRHDLLWGPSFLKGASKEVQAEQLCKYYIERQVSGVFFAPMEHFEGRDAVNVSIARALDEAHIPIVLLDRDIALFPQRSKYDLVGIDNHRAGYVLAEYLLHSGSQRVAFVATPFSAHTVDARIGGYKEALYNHYGAAARPLVKWIDPSDVATVEEFLRREQPDAIICANDFTAARLLRTVTGVGVQVPAQLRIAGIDDVKYAQLLQTSLTTIRQPCLEIGSTALLAMLDRIAHPAAPAREFIVDFELIIRKSTETSGGERLQADKNRFRSIGEAVGLQPTSEGRVFAVSAGGIMPSEEAEP